MARKRLSLFVWADCFYDYSAGLAFALAHDAEEARALIVEKIGYTHGDLAQAPQVFEVDGPPVAFYVHGGS